MLASLMFFLRHKFSAEICHLRAQIGLQTIDAFDSRHRTQPRQLPFGELARGGDAGFA